MPRIPSPNPQSFQTVTGQLGGRASANSGYKHPADSRSNQVIPMAFQVTSPLDYRRVLLPHALVLHVNPFNIQEMHTEKVDRSQTRGGWVEQHWGSDLTEISAEGSTGAFMNIRTGLTSCLRQRTIAWDRYRDLLELYKNNASVRDPRGSIVLQGQVLLMFDRGSYLGTFRNFETTETDESPFAFTFSWSFKVEHTLIEIPAILSRNVNLPPSPSQIQVTSDLEAPEDLSLERSAADAIEKEKERQKLAKLNAAIAEAVYDEERGIPR